MSTTEKLQKIIANLGLGSRREIERWIEAGRVSINGSIAKLGDRATLDDKIRVDGRLLSPAKRQVKRHRQIIYYKPEGEVCTRDDPERRPTVFEHLPKLSNGRWVMVGRLDLTTSGLLLFTTDGELANRLMHPSYGVEREYAVRVLGKVTPDMIQQLSEGINLDDGFAKFNKIDEAGGEGANHWYHVTLNEGRNREVRRLWEAVGVTVSRLIRIRFGNLELPKTLKRGQFEDLAAPELKKLKKLVNYE